MKIYIGIVIFIMLMTGLYTYFNGKSAVATASPTASAASTFSATPTASSPVGNTVGSNAPIFRLASYSGVSTGIADFKGVEGVVLYFWNTACLSCGQDLSMLAGLQESSQNRFIPLAINRGDPPESARTASDRAGTSNRFPHLLDPTDSIYNLYGGTGMPYYVFIDRNGVIQAIESGSVSRQVIEQDLSKIL